MRHQVAQRHRLGRRPQFRCAAFVKAVEHLQRGKFRDELTDGLVELQLPLLHQLHGAGRHDGFRHRRDPEDGIERHRIGLAEITFAERAFIDDLAAGRGDGNNAWNCLALGGTLKQRVELRQLLHERSPLPAVYVPRRFSP